MNTERRRWDWSARAPLVLIAGFPEVGVTARHLLEIEEAVLSFSRAAFAAGRRVALPGDRLVAPLVSRVAAEYVPPPGSEGAGEGSRPIELMLTEGGDERLEGILARLGHADQLRVGGRKREEPYADRHPLTFEAISLSAPQAALAVGGDAGMVDDLELLREHEVEVVPIVPTLAGLPRKGWQRWGTDVASEILAEAGWEAVSRPTGPSLTPYPYLMQQLVAGWDEPERLPDELGGPQSSG
jgi:hypothetical protein